MVKIKGHEIEEPNIKNSFDRKAVQLQNSIIHTLNAIGVVRDYVEVPLKQIAQRNFPASASWYFEGRNLKYSYSQMSRFIDNLYIIDQVLKIEVKRLVSGEITADQFKNEFLEDDELDEKLVEARKTLGVSDDEKDFELISKKYKDLAKTHHPDMPDGDHEKFQKINAAHKLIKKELQ